MKPSPTISRVRILAASCLVAAVALLPACTTTQESGSFPTKTAVGSAAGAAAGGLIGAAAGGGTKGIVGGVLAGGLLGGLAGNALDQRDRQIAAQNARLALETAPTGTAQPWQNPDTGNRGTFTPTRTYQEPSGRYCREYTQEIWVAGERQMAYGRACRQPDGTWQVVE